jgi:hypothetical protein
MINFAVGMFFSLLLTTFVVIGSGSWVVRSGSKLSYGVSTAVVGFTMWYFILNMNYIISVRVETAGIHDALSTLATVMIIFLPLVFAYLFFNKGKEQNVS